MLGDSFNAVSNASVKKAQCLSGKLTAGSTGWALMTNPAKIRATRTSHRPILDNTGLVKWWRESYTDNKTGRI